MSAPTIVPINEVAAAGQAWLLTARAIGQHRRACTECAGQRVCPAGATYWQAERVAWEFAETVRRATL